MTALAEKTNVVAKDLAEKSKGTKSADDKAKKKQDDAKKQAALNEQQTEDALRFEEQQIVSEETEITFE